MNELQTERLVLRNFKIEDQEDCFIFLSDEKTCWDDGGYPPFSCQNEDYMQVMNTFLEQKDRYMIVEKTSNRVIGTINVMDSEIGDHIKSIGYVMSPQYRRKGYAYEGVKTVIEFYFQEKGIEQFLATCFLYNQASECLLKKLGFVEVGIIEMGIEHVEYGTMDLKSFILKKQE